MDKKTKTDQSATPTVSLERARRLVRLVQILGAGSQARAKLMRPLRLDVRGFYRDLQCLRSAGIDVTLENGKYALRGKQEDALSRVPFPDPGLSLGEAMTLARGRTSPHQKLKQIVSELLGSGGAMPATSKQKSKKPR